MVLFFFPKSHIDAILYLKKNEKNGVVGGRGEGNGGGRRTVVKALPWDPGDLVQFLAVCP